MTEGDNGCKDIYGTHTTGVEILSVLSGQCRLRLVMKATSDEGLNPFVLLRKVIATLLVMVLGEAAHAAKVNGSLIAVTYIRGEPQSKRGRTDFYV